MQRALLALYASSQLTGCAPDHLPYSNRMLSRGSIAQRKLAANSIRDTLMPPQDRQTILDQLPDFEDEVLSTLLRSDRVLWYNKQSIVPGYQDSMGSPKGMRPNTIAPGHIDTAVPGGHATLFSAVGRFQFPFGTGGVDKSPNAASVNFWIPPLKDGKILPVVYWQLSFSRYQWAFPVGTILGEVLFTNHGNGHASVFEVRTRQRQLGSWESKVFRPFLTATSFADAIETLMPNWQDSGSLVNLINHLHDPNSISSLTLESRNYAVSFDPVTVFIDELPNIEDASLVAQLLRANRFKELGTTVWKQNSAGAIAYGPSTTGTSNIVPMHYEGAGFTPNSQFCDRCHNQAGRAIADFYPTMAAYGEMWGEDHTFSWHPFANEMFVDASGRVRNFNDDNRRIRNDFINAGVLALYNPTIHSNSYYCSIPKNWTYRPF